MEIRITNKSTYKDFVDYEKRLYGMKRAILHRPVFSEKSLIWKYVSVLRRCELYENTGRKILYKLYRLKKHHLRLKTGFSIPNNVCDMGLKINHLGNIHLSADSIGKDCTIAGVCYAIKNGLKEGAPKIGDGVFLGMNCTLIGPIMIGDGCLVGAGAIVTSSFATPNCVIAGVPAREIKRDVNWKK